jgi:protein TonB
MLGLPLAATITLGLFVIMSGLIAQPPRTDPPKDPLKPKILADYVEPTPGPKPPKQIMPKETPPPVDTRDRTRIDKPGGVPVDLGPIDGIDNPDIPKPGNGTPMITVAPPYPEACKARGAEGVVLVRFDVTDRGEVTNVEIISSDNHCFDQTVKRTVRSWKYPPEARRGLVQRFVFSLDDE